MRNAVALLLSCAAVCHAQERFPSRPIELIVPFAPGGPTDVAARILQPVLARELTGTVVVVNKGGAGGVVGTDFVAKAEPNGYTLAVTTNSVLTTAPATMPNVAYKPADFAAIGAFAVDYQAIVSRPDARWKTFADFIAFAKRTPGKLSYGSAGIGTISFFNMEILKLREGLDVVHVPFQGTGPAVTGILGGQVDIAASAMGAMLPHMRAKKLDFLVTTTPKRLADAPQVPTMLEQGYPEATLNTIVMAFAPARTSAEVLMRLRTALERAAQDPGLVAGLEKAGLNAEYFNAEATMKSVDTDIGRVRAVAGSIKGN